MKIIGFTLTMEEAVEAFITYAEKKGADVDIHEKWFIIQQDNGDMDCVQNEHDGVH